MGTREIEGMCRPWEMPVKGGCRRLESNLVDARQELEGEERGGGGASEWAMPRGQSMVCCLGANRDGQTNGNHCGRVSSAGLDWMVLWTLHSLLIISFIDKHLSHRRHYYFLFIAITKETKKHYIENMSHFVQCDIILITKQSSRLVRVHSLWNRSDGRINGLSSFSCSWRFVSQRVDGSGRSNRLECVRSQSMVFFVRSLLSSRISIWTTIHFLLSTTDRWTIARFQAIDQTTVSIVRCQWRSENRLRRIPSLECLDQWWISETEDRMSRPFLYEEERSRILSKSIERIPPRSLRSLRHVLVQISSQSTHCSTVRRYHAIDFNGDDAMDTSRRWTTSLVLTRRTISSLSVGWGIIRWSSRSQHIAEILKSFCHRLNGLRQQRNQYDSIRFDEECELVKNTCDT